MNNFTISKELFDEKNRNKTTFDCFLPVDLIHDKQVSIKNKHNKQNEEYYKWQFLSAIVNSGMYAKDYIGTEVYFPKGNKSSAPIKFDSAIFDDKEWFDHYNNWRQNKEQKDLDWLRKHLIGIIEFKKEDNKDIEAVYNQQLKPALKESEKDFCLGILYDTERLYLFRKYKTKFLRLSDEYNQKNEDSGTKELSLHLPDPYLNLPTFNEIIEWENPKEKSRSTRGIINLNIISGIHSTQINDAMSSILRTMDKHGLVKQKGYEILIQILALKIFDEKRNEKNPIQHLDFYITKDEKQFKDLNDSNIRSFIKRIHKLWEDAEGTYNKILKEKTLDLSNENHVRVLVEVVTQFQDYTFVRSYKTDLYQLVFYRFASKFSEAEHAQFVTPLPLIDFLVKIVNPRNGETVIDPTVGIADFLSISYVNSNSKLDDGNIFGIDIDEQMIMLATLNMLLNGDGNAKLKAKPGFGSILSKYDTTSELIELVPSINQKGEWDKRFDNKKLKKFDVVLTNPPFGDDRAFRIESQQHKDIIECFELWHTARSGDSIDLGLVFLENAYRILDTNGRIGIVLSNSIASVDKYQRAREWLLNKMRIVAIFDLPPNVFAETAVPTTLFVAYKPEKKELEKLKSSNYKVFLRDIHKVGYEVRTSKRVKYFADIYKINPETFDIEIDSEGRPVIDEEFSDTIKEFGNWCLTQEKTLQDLFVNAK